MDLLCPICAQRLQLQEKTYCCQNRHCFDIARQGYVNLLPVQNKRSLNPGDTTEQVLARREFLSAGYYKPILEALCQMAKPYNGPILDVGCGEGYYSAGLAQALHTQLVGLDISKEAVRRAAGMYKNALWLCGSAARLPISEESVGILTSLFALTVPEEFHRVLKQDGIFFQVLAAPDHLLSLKSIIYPELIHKEKDIVPQLPGFRLLKSQPVRFTFTVEGQQVRNLLSMTPHVYRISKEGHTRLENTHSLTDTASCVINLFQKI